MPVKAADIMTREVVTAKPEEKVQSLAKRLADHGISAMPVCDGEGHLLGMVSEGDLLRPFTKERMLKRAWWLEVLAEGQDLAPEFQAYLSVDSRRAQDLMTQPVVSATEEAGLEDLADLMTEKSVKRLPILRAGKLVGIVSRADLIKALARGERN